MTSPAATLDYEEEIADILAAVTGKRPFERSQAAEETRRRIELCRRAIRLIDKQRDCYRWAFFHAALGAYLFDVASKYEDGAVESADTMEAAVNAIRRSLEVFTPDDAPGVWGIAMRNLGRAFQRRKKGDQAANVELAITCQKQSLLAFPPNTHSSEWAATLHSLGHAYRARGRDADGVNLTLAVEAFHRAGYVAELTPLSGDKGRDVVATKHGIGSIRIFDQVKGYRVSHLVTY